jgi:hypothetical protein
VERTFVKRCRERAESQAPGAAKKSGRAVNDRP